MGTHLNEGKWHEKNSPVRSSAAACTPDRLGSNRKSGGRGPEMIELNKEINTRSLQLNRAKPYRLHDDHNPLSGANDERT